MKKSIGPYLKLSVSQCVSTDRRSEPIIRLPHLLNAAFCVCPCVCARACVLWGKLKEHCALGNSHYSSAKEVVFFLDLLVERQQRYALGNSR